MEQGFIKVAAITPKIKGRLYVKSLRMPMQRVLKSLFFQSCVSQGIPVEIYLCRSYC